MLIGIRTSPEGSVPDAFRNTEFETMCFVCFYFWIRGDRLDLRMDAG